IRYFFLKSQCRICAAVAVGIPLNEYILKPVAVYITNPNISTISIYSIYEGECGFVDRTSCHGNGITKNSCFIAIDIVRYYYIREIVIIKICNGYVTTSIYQCKVGSIYKIIGIQTSL